MSWGPNNSTSIIPVFHYESLLGPRLCQIRSPNIVLLHKWESICSRGGFHQMMFRYGTQNVGNGEM